MPTPTGGSTPEGYDSVALGVLDSIYSTGHKYTGVTNALDKYRAARRSEDAESGQDTASVLVAAVDRWGGIAALVERTNKWPTSSKAGVPKQAAAAFGTAKILTGHGLNTVAEVRAAFATAEQQDASPVKRLWLGLPGQGSGLTWTYFLMLCGVPGVKADRMVVRYVSRAVREAVDGKDARRLVSSVARPHSLELTPDELTSEITKGRLDGSISISDRRPGC
ncbi:hypothetical protein BA895_22340 [Humibacillus sp. DSM 29435]|nr:hypothetical protein BA895_22340 [Humibacillus sp. DSM 29435]